MSPGITRPPSLLTQKEVMMNATVQEASRFQQRTVQEAPSPEAFKAEVDELVLEAHRAEGYVRDDGDDVVYDNDALASKIRVLVLDSTASTKQERQQKAVRRGTLTALAYPSVSSPGSPNWDPDDKYSEHVFKALRGCVTRLIASGRRGKVQQLLAEDGLVLCQTKVGDDKVEAVYVTNNPSLILSDFAVPRTSKLQNVSEEMAQDFNLVIDRIPEMRKQMNAKLESGMKAAQVAARAKLALTAGEDEDEENA